MEWLSIFTEHTDLWALKCHGCQLESTQGSYRVGIVDSVNECKILCIRRENCTAIEYGDDKGLCDLQFGYVTTEITNVEKQWSSYILNRGSF